MVKSRLEPNLVEYEEWRKVDPNDLCRVSPLYLLEIDGVEVLIAVGAAKDKKRANITYFPVYLVKSNNTVFRIGLYEIRTTDRGMYLDDKLQLEVEKMEDPPLLFPFVRRDFLEEFRKIPGQEPEPRLQQKPVPDTEVEVEVELPEPIPVSSNNKNKKKRRKVVKEVNDNIVTTTSFPIISKRVGIFHLDDGADQQAVAALPAETSKQAKQTRDNYRAHPPSNPSWIQEFMQNAAYDIKDNEGGGDCLFAVIRDAFAQIGQKTTVQKLRSRLANEVLPETFTSYKELYTMHKAVVDECKELSKKISRRNEEIKQTSRLLTDVNRIRALQDEHIALKKQHAETKSRCDYAKTFLNEVKFMEKVQDFEQFKQIIQTCDFWADNMSIELLERALNIKLIILSSQSFLEGDVNNVLRSTGTSSKETFMPDLYIIADYTGDHYKLIQYKNRGIFKFEELPYDIKRLCASKCIGMFDENHADTTLYCEIPELNEFQRQLDTKQKGGGKKSRRHRVKKSGLGTGEARLLNLFSDDAVFVLSRNAAGYPVPGRGEFERIKPELLVEFHPLHKMTHWRRKLDDGWVQPFVLDDHRWASVDHYYQAAQYKRKFPDFYLTFSLDSGTELSQRPEMALNHRSHRPKTVHVDPDFEDHFAKEARDAAQLAKFEQNPDLRSLLLATQNAKLMKSFKDRAPETLDSLMILRDQFSKR